jgi:Copper amine oxidase, enzyme domain
MPDGPANPFGVGFCATETVLKTEQQAQRNGNPAKSRIWKIKNPSSLNRMNGEQVCTYAIMRLHTVSSRLVSALALTLHCSRLDRCLAVLNRPAGGLEAGAWANTAAIRQPQQLAPPPRQICHQGGSSATTVHKSRRCASAFHPAVASCTERAQLKCVSLLGCAAPVGDAIC